MDVVRELSTGAVAGAATTPRSASASGRWALCRLSVAKCRTARMRSHLDRSPRPSLELKEGGGVVSSTAFDCPRRLLLDRALQLTQVLTEGSVRVSAAILQVGLEVKLLAQRDAASELLELLGFRVADG